MTNEEKRLLAKSVPYGEQFLQEPLSVVLDYFANLERTRDEAREYAAQAIDADIPLDDAMSPFYDALVDGTAFESHPSIDRLRLLVEGDEGEFTARALRQYLSNAARRLGCARAALVAMTLAEFYRLMEGDGPSGVLKSDASLRSHAAADESDAFVFARDGGTYYVAAYGESGRVRSSLKGIGQLVQLLRVPGCGISMRVLNGGPVALADAGDLQESTDWVAMHAFDDEARAKLAKEVAQLKQDIDGPDTLVAEESQRKLEEIEHYVKQATGAFGKQRNIGGDLEKLRPAIHGTIKRACNALTEAGLPSTASHLEVSVRSKGGEFFYDPQPVAPSWRFELPKKV